MIRIDRDDVRQEAALLALVAARAHGIETTLDMVQERAERLRNAARCRLARGERKQSRMLSRIRQAARGMVR